MNIKDEMIWPVKEARLTGDGGVFAISLVENPAIKVPFELYNDDLPLLKPDLKGIVTGPILIANKKILRTMADKPYFIYFSEDTVRETAYKFLASQKGYITINHNGVNHDVKIIESWVSEDPLYDKSHKFGYKFDNITWMGSLQLTPELVEMVSKQSLLGFSIEGLFNYVDVSDITTSIPRNRTELDDLLDEIQSL